MEKFAYWCIKRQVDVDKALVIMACIVASLAITLECLAAFKCKNEYLIAVGALEILGMFIGGFLIDVGEIVRKINKGEKQ